MDPFRPISSSNSYEDLQRMIASLEQLPTQQPPPPTTIDPTQTGDNFSHSGLLDRLPQPSARRMHLLNSVAHSISPRAVESRITMYRPSTSASAVADPSTQLNYTITDLRDALASEGYTSLARIAEGTLQSRINALLVTIPTLIETINIAKNRNHPIMNTIHDPYINKSKILYTLNQIFNYQNLNPKALRAIQSGANNPQQIALNIIQMSP